MTHLVTAPTVHLRTPAGVVTLDRGDEVPSDVDGDQLAKLVAAGAVGEAGTRDTSDEDGEAAADGSSAAKPKRARGKQA